MPEENTALTKLEDDPKIKELEEAVRYHRNLYYNQTPEISDAKYDALEDELRALDPENPVFTEVGADASRLFEKVEHLIPMGSQDKVTTPADFRKWAKKRGFNRFLVQFKLDGISIEVQYEEGSFVRAVTRGDGKRGDDVSVNVRKMKGFIPELKSKFTGGIRGEILMLRDVFDVKYSSNQNCRNTAAGLVRRKDGVGCEDLNIIYYDAISFTDVVKFESEIKKIRWLKEEHFPTIKTKTLNTPEEVIKVREDVSDNIRDSLEYDIDGLVIKGNEIDLEDMKRARPQKQIAFKFQAEQIETKVINVEWSKNGHNYTPVAIVEQVELLGSKINRASLANPDLILDLRLKIGAEVMLSKRGDVIPKIEVVLSIPPDAKEIIVPTTCEVCETKLINEGTRLYCPNPRCPKRLYHRLKKWIKTLDVKYFSQKLMLKPLFDAGRIQTIADLYTLKASDLTLLEGVKEKSAKKALDNLNNVKEVPLDKFIGGFDIEGIGEQMIKKITSTGVSTLEELNKLSVSELASIDGFADITATTLKDGLTALIDEMEAVLKTKKVAIKTKSSSRKLDGLSFCFTGKLETMKRNEVQGIVEDNGGIFKKSVVKNLSYLVTNDTTPTAKYTKAKDQGTEIISEKEFLEMII